MCTSLATGVSVHWSYPPFPVCTYLAIGVEVHQYCSHHSQSQMPKKNAWHGCTLQQRLKQTVLLQFLSTETNFHHSLMCLSKMWTSSQQWLSPSYSMSVPKKHGEEHISHIGCPSTSCIRHTLAATKHMGNMDGSHKQWGQNKSNPPSKVLLPLKCLKAHCPNWSTLIKLQNIENMMQI